MSRWTVLPAMGLALTAWSARADDASPLRATVQCDPVAEPGRVRCDAELRPKTGAVRWADVQVVDTPDFIVPLRGRSGPHDASAHEDDLWRWGLGLVARTRGEGDVTLRLRAVVCGAASCTPETLTTRAHVVVGR